jgi:hypothetical protein
MVALSVLAHCAVTLALFVGGAFLGWRLREGIGK